MPAYIGQLLNQPELTALIQAQMYLEADVSHDPEPTIVLQPIPNGIAARIAYTSVQTGEPVLLSFDVTP
ncbi:MAG: hypothetical protein U0835_00085 [Isosphaeraceae bacterium]